MSGPNPLDMLAGGYETRSLIELSACFEATIQTLQETIRETWIGQILLQLPSSGVMYRASPGFLPRPHSAGVEYNTKPHI